MAKRGVTTRRSTSGRSASAPTVPSKPATRRKASATPQFARGERVVIVLGAGATRACDGPLTREILPTAFAANRQGNLQILDKLLVETFGVPATGPRTEADYPPLPTLLSLLDTAIDRGHGLGANWPVETLREVRRQAEFAVFQSIAYAMRKKKSWDILCHEDLLQNVIDNTGAWPTVISFNYDLRIDYAMMAINGDLLPDYGCAISTAGYKESQKTGKLLKLHGSMHWLYCPTCDRLELGVDRELRLRKIGLSQLRHLSAAKDFVPSLEGRTLGCPDCNSGLRAVMITPTSLKDYRNPHIARLWFEAERALREADRIVFIGYSMPWDDIDVIYMLKRGILGRERAPRITVVERAASPTTPITEHEAGQRYRALFGRNIDWQPMGFVDWVKRLK